MEKNYLEVNLMRESEGFAIDRRWEAGWVFNGFTMGLQWVYNGFWY